MGGAWWCHSWWVPDRGKNERRLRRHRVCGRSSGSSAQVNTEGIRTAVFYTKVRDRLLGPLLNAGHQPPAPVELRRALKQIDQSLTGYTTGVGLGTAA